MEDTNENEKTLTIRGNEKKKKELRGNALSSRHLVRRRSQLGGGALRRWLLPRRDVLLVEVDLLLAFSLHPFTVEPVSRRRLLVLRHLARVALVVCRFLIHQLIKVLLFQRQCIVIQVPHQRLLICSTDGGDSHSAIFLRRGLHLPRGLLALLLTPRERLIVKVVDALVECLLRDGVTRYQRLQLYLGAGAARKAVHALLQLRLGQPLRCRATLVVQVHSRCCSTQVALTLMLASILGCMCAYRRVKLYRTRARRRHQSN